MRYPVLRGLVIFSVFLAGCGSGVAPESGTAWTTEQLQSEIHHCITLSTMTASESGPLTVVEADAYCSCIFGRISAHYSFAQYNYLTSEDSGAPANAFANLQKESGAAACAALVGPTGTNNVPPYLP